MLVDLDVIHNTNGRTDRTLHSSCSAFTPSILCVKENVLLSEHVMSGQY